MGPRFSANSIRVGVSPAPTDNMTSSNPDFISDSCALNVSNCLPATSSVVPPASRRLSSYDRMASLLPNRAKVPASVSSVNPNWVRAARCCSTLRSPMASSIWPTMSAMLLKLP